jgi:integrating conjugative element protein (TIGR03759 family)
MSSAQLRAAALSLALTQTLSAAAAETVASEPTHSQVQQTATVETPLSPTEAARAELWGLTPSEWRRYRELMQGIRGSISPANLSPIEVLGIHARDEAERRRYAQVWVQAMHPAVARVLAFQRAYDEASKRLYPGELLIDPARVPRAKPRSTDLSKDDRVLLFIRPDCPGCDALLGRLLQRLDQIAGIDLYLVGLKPGDEQAVRHWAAGHGIRPAWVSARRVTLNFDAGTLGKLTPDPPELPVLMRRRGETITPLAASDLR